MKFFLCLFAISSVVSGGLLNRENSGGYSYGYNGGHNSDSDIVPIIAALFSNGGHNGGANEGDFGGRIDDTDFNTPDLTPVIAAISDNGENNGHSNLINRDSFDTGSSYGISSEIIQAIAALYGHYGANLGFDRGQSSPGLGGSDYFN